MTLDRLGRPLRDLRISVTDRCNFRCVYCMPKEVFGSDYRFLERKELLTFEEIARVARVFVGLGVQKLRLTGGEPLVRKDIDRLIALLAPLGAELTLTTNASLLAPKAAGAGRRRPRPRHREPRLARRRDVPRDERRRLPGAARARGDRRGGRGRAAGEGERRDQARAERPLDPRARRATSAAPATRCASSSTWTSATTNGWRLDDVVPAAEIVERISARVPARAGRARLPRRGREALALPGRRRRDRPDLVGHAALLRRLHARAHLGRGPPLHVPLRRARPRPARARPRRRHRRRPARGDHRDLGQAHRPLLRASLAGDGLAAARWR